MLNTKLNDVGETLSSFPESEFETQIDETYSLCSIELPPGKWIVIGATLAIGNLEIENADYVGKSRSYQENAAPESTSITVGFSSGGKTITLKLEAKYTQSLVHADGNYCYLRAIKIS